MCYRRQLADNSIVSIAQRNPNVTLTFMSDAEQERYMAAVNRLLSLADFERKSRANQPPDWHLRRVERLMAMLDNPHLATPVVHVAGSKGKGSTCAMIAAGLNAAGFQTGLYTSPHLHTFTERIQVDGENISPSDFADLIDELWPYAEAIERRGDMGVVSVFEMLTAMAFVHFRNIAADFAVIETGLGGRLDATNVVDPEVSVITPISLDHVGILGNTISLIAREKAGILKPCKPAVVAKNHPAAWRVIKERAQEIGVELVSACATIPASTSGGVVDGNYKQEFVLKRSRKTGPPTPTELLIKPPDPGLTDVNISTTLLGGHQIDNARTAAATFNVLYGIGHEFDVNSAILGIGNARWPCRTEVLDIDGWPPIVLDGAHNDASLKALHQALIEHVSRLGGNLGNGDDAKDSIPSYVLVIGATEGHEFEDMARQLAASATYSIATQSRHPKSSPASRLVDAAKPYGVDFSASLTVENALIQAKRKLDADPSIKLIIVTGSLFVAAEAREHLLDIEPEIYEDLRQPYISPYQSDETIESKIA